MGTSRLRRIALRAAMLLVSTALAVGAAELGLRIVDHPKDHWSPWVRAEVTGTMYAPHLSQRWQTGEFDIVFRTNSQGMRDDEIGRKRGYRVLLLGDSFASGYGVHREQQFADLLERELGVEFVNTATGGWDLEHQVYFFRDRGPAFEPDLVLYAMYLGNDIIRNGQRRLDARGIAPDRRKPARTTREPKLSLLWQQARHAWSGREIAKKREWMPYGVYLAMCERALSPAAERDYRATREFLAELQAEVAASGARFLVAWFSYRTVVEPRAREAFRARVRNFDARYDLDRPPREVAAYLDELGIAHVDLNAPLAAAAASGELLYYEKDGHWNARAHRVVADALAPILTPLITESGDPGAGAGARHQ